MPSFCAVANCNDRYGHSENISFHKFPLKRVELLCQWEAFIQRQRGGEWHASRWSSLCSRHFREDDFRSLNERRTLKKTAVPTILADSKEKNKEIDEGSRAENAGDTEFKEIMAIKERLEDVGSSTKTNCRLCGFTCAASVTFTLNYELYGMLQKCFPTLTIQQDDALPKALCASCNKDLNNFGEFVDRVWMAQTELQRKYRSRIAEKPLKIKQEPMVRVKQEVVGTGTEDYEGEGAHEEGEDSMAVDQKYEFCDFPIMNDCDIMEIINLDDPFINIPDDDNTTTNNEPLELDKQLGAKSAYIPSAHELLQEHLLMEEHNYAYMETDDFKEERHVYKTEKSDADERKTETSFAVGVAENKTIMDGSSKSIDVVLPNATEETTIGCNSTSVFENRALKPIVTSVSAIQQPSKANGIVVLNESIVKSGGGFQLHECMVCQLKFFSIESLKRHYTQTHGTPMVTVPTANIVPDRLTANACKTEKEFGENLEDTENLAASVDDVLQKTGLVAYQATGSNQGRPIRHSDGELEFEQKSTKLKEEQNIRKTKKPSKAKPMARLRNTKRKPNSHININKMAFQYQQLNKLYQKLQRKCTNLEQNVEQLQLHPSTNVSLHRSKTYHSQDSTKPILRNVPVTSSKHAPHLPADSNLYTCAVCLKSFSNSNSLRQHKITHSEERRHQCSLCQRSFKRRNGLLQHLKGFHLQVKPFVCPVCNHTYSLKCDMLRCKHSILKTNRLME